MGTEREIRRSDAGMISFVSPADSGLPDYSLSRLPEGTRNIVFLITSFQGEEVNRYAIGIIRPDGFVASATGWEEMLRQEIVPIRVIDIVREYFRLTGSSGIPSINF